MVPWAVVLNNPTYAIFLPFAWLLWQVYFPRFITWLFGQDPADGFIYSTWWTSVKTEFKTEFDRVDSRVGEMENNVSQIVDTQEKLVNVTVAQSHMLNGYDGDIDVESVEERLITDEQDKPSDYRVDDPYEDGE